MSEQPNSDQPAYAVFYSDEDRPEDRERVTAALMKFNRQHGAPANFVPLNLFLTSAEGTVVGGLCGHTAYRWLFVQVLFVPEPLRGAGLGRSLLQQAEDIARQRQCIGVWLDTAGFQTLGFYRHLGYSLFGELQDHPPGISQYWLQKRLALAYPQP